MSKDKCKTGIFTIGKTGHVHRRNKNTATAVSRHTGVAGAVHSRFLLFCEGARRLPTYRPHKLLSRLLYHRGWHKARKKKWTFGGIWGVQYVKYSPYDEWESIGFGNGDFATRFARALFEPLPAIIPKTKTPPCRVVFCFWSGRRGSNSLPRPWQGRALPDELRPHVAPTVFGQCHGASGRS